jgi:tetratricopeptide (TPR) repeat protein
MTEKRYVKLPRAPINVILAILIFQVAAFAAQSEVLTHSLLKAARRAFADGQYKQTEDYLRQAAAESELVRTSDSDRALILGDLANVLLTTGKFDEAEDLLNRAIAILKSSNNEDRRLLPILLGNLGKLYHQTGRIGRSETVLRESLQLGKQFLTDAPQYLADLHNNLGVVYLHTLKLKKAEREFKSALRLIDGTSNAMEVRRAAILANLSISSRRNGALRNRPCCVPLRSSSVRRDRRIPISVRSSITSQT